MKKWIIGVILLMPVASFASGPVYSHPQPVMEEFRNVYDEIGSFSDGIVQIVSYETTTSSAITSSSYIMTHSSASITLSDPANKVLLIANASCRDAVGSGNNARITFFRDSTDLDSTTNGFQTLGYTAAGITNIDETCSMVYLDSPNSSSELLYSVRAKTSGGTISYGVSGTQTLILIEIGKK